MYIFCGRGLASRRWRQVSSNVRPRKTKLRQCPQRSSTAVNTSVAFGHLQSSQHNSNRSRCRSPIGFVQHSPALNLGLQHVHRHTAFHHASTAQQSSTAPHLRDHHSKQSQFVGPQPRPQSWWLPAVHAAAGDTNGAVGHAVARLAASFKLGPNGFCTQALGMLSTAWPNPSVKLSTNGRPPSPSHRYGVHFLWLGLGGLPLAPAYLKR